MQSTSNLYWTGALDQVSFDEQTMPQKLKETGLPCFVVENKAGQMGITNAGEITTSPTEIRVRALAPALEAKQLGDPTFCRDYKLKYACKAGAMANGIASEELVIAMGKGGMLGSFGAAGLVPNRIQEAIDRITTALPTESKAYNLIHSPGEEALEAGAVERYLKNKITVVEASAFLGLTKHIVQYRVAGLSQQEDGSTLIQNKVIAKLSRKEVANRFMQPAPKKLLQILLDEEKITPLQAELALTVPMADDITVEADSGGHTDNRPLINILPSIIRLRNELQEKYKYSTAIRIGAAGGIATPESALSAFMLGAAYIVTGSINQSCVEAGTSDHVRKLLSRVSQTDVMMAPASDMFEMGVKVQILKRGSLFGPRAQKLYDYYQRYASIDALPEEIRLELEEKVFQAPLETIWQSCVDFFTARDPKQIEKAKDNPKRKMALIFRWYLGLSSNWANAGNEGRKSDFQIWCGPSMGAFNEWVKGSYLQNFEQRKVADINQQIMEGAAYLYRIKNLEMQGVALPLSARTFEVQPL